MIKSTYPVLTYLIAAAVPLQAAFIGLDVVGQASDGETQRSASAGWGFHAWRRRADGATIVLCPRRS
jgi:hypothetical protein